MCKIFFIIWEYFEWKMFRLNTNIIYSKILSKTYSKITTITPRLHGYSFATILVFLPLGNCNCHKSTADDKQNKKDGYNSKKYWTIQKALKKEKKWRLEDLFSGPKVSYASGYWFWWQIFQSPQFPMTDVNSVIQLFLPSFLPSFLVLEGVAQHYSLYLYIHR